MAGFQHFKVDHIKLVRIRVLFGFVNDGALMMINSFEKAFYPYLFM